MAELPADFDEAAYLDANPDVAAAVLRGAVPDGASHWLASGRREGRALSFAGSRNGIVRSQIAVDGRGIELGPLDRGIMPKREGYRVEIVDFLDTAALRSHYGDVTERGVDGSMIEDVDHVSHGGPLTELVGETGVFEWVVASHVIEHIPDLVTFLQDVERLLSPTGRLALVVPDKRYCFDVYGELSSAGQVLDAHLAGRTEPSPGQVFDYFARTASVGSSIAWGRVGDVEPDAVYTTEQATESYRRALDGFDFEGEIHCWRFTPESFRMLISELRSVGLIALDVVAEHDTVGIEFFVTLGRVAGSDRTSVDRTGTLRATWASDRG